MVTLASPELADIGDDGQGVAMVWLFKEPVMALSSAPVGPGLGPIDWLVNIGVDLRYSRTDLADHVAEVAARVGLDGDASWQTPATPSPPKGGGYEPTDRGIGLLTAASLKRRQFIQYGSVRVDATVGVSKPTWASERLSSPQLDSWQPGTINIVVQLPVALELTAAVNAVITITEAKSQALIQTGVPGTGTASDAVVLCWPTTGNKEKFGGPRSQWGSVVANATYEAVSAGLTSAPTHRGQEQ